MTRCVSAVTPNICLNNCFVSSCEEFTECFLKGMDWWIRDQLIACTEGELCEEERALSRRRDLKVKFKLLLH